MNDRENEDLESISQSDSKEKGCKQNILLETDQLSGSRNNLQNPKEVIKKCSKITEKVDQMNPEDISPNSKKENMYLNFVNSSFTPSKLSKYLFDSTFSDEFEAVEMQHDIDIISDLNILQLTTDSKLDISFLDQDFENQDLVVSTSPTNKNYGRTRKQIPRKCKVEGSRKIETINDSSKSVTLNKDYSSSDEDIDESARILEELYEVESKEILPPETVEKLLKLKIKLIHDVPPQHKVESAAGSTSIKAKEIIRFEKFVKRNRNKFSEDEDNIVKQNWKSFCEIHNWEEKDVKPFLQMKYQGTLLLSSFTERQKFVQFLANGLPCRSLFAVYSRFKFLFTTYSSKGRFTSEEDKKIISYMKCPEKSNKKYAELAKVLGRTRTSITKRYSVLTKMNHVKCQNAQKQKCVKDVIWSLDLIGRFLKTLLEVTLNDDIFELKNALIPKVVWQEMERKLKIKENILKNFWFKHLHMQLFSPDTIYMTDVKIKLIEYLYNSEISHPKDIDWNEVKNLFDGMTTSFLCEITHRLLHGAKYHNKKDNFEETVNYLYEVTIPRLIRKPKDKLLPRLLYKNNTLKVLDKVEKVNSNEESEEELKLPKRRSVRFSLVNEKEHEEEENSDAVWTLEKRRIFLQTFLDVMICENVEDLKGALIPKVVWKEMEKRLSADQTTLRNLWHNELHLQLFSPDPIYMNDLKIKLIELISLKNFETLEEINWEQVCAYFDGMTADFLSSMFDELVEFASKTIDSTDFSEILSYLFKNIISQLKQKSKDNCLPRLIYENSKLKIVDEIEKVELLEKELKLSKKQSIILNEQKVENEENFDTFWTLERREIFLQTFIDVMICENVEDLKGALIPEVVWNEVEQRLSVNQSTLQNLWYNELHLQLFSSNPIYMNDLKIKLIELIYWKNFKRQEEINWGKICIHFDGVTEVFLSQMFHYLIEIASKMTNSTEFCEIVSYLYKNVITHIRNKVKDKHLPRLSYNNKKLKILDKVEALHFNKSSEEKFKLPIERREKFSRLSERKFEDKENIDAVYKSIKREVFLQTLLDVMICKNIQELKGAFIPAVVWDEIENQLNVDKKILQNLWYKELHLQLFSPDPIYLNDLKMKLIELIHWKNFKFQKEINWNKVCCYFDGMTAVFLSEVFNELVDFAAKRIDSTEFCDIADYLYKVVFNKLKTKPVDKFLPRITYKNKMIKVITEDFEDYAIDKSEYKLSDESEN